MTIKARIPVVIAGALAATTIAGVAAFASPATGTAPVDMGGQPSHMAELEDEALDAMAAMMDDAGTIGEMHRQMADPGMPVGQMHREMHPEMGAELGVMHRPMAGPAA
jgi:hypothetical protein